MRRACSWSSLRTDIGTERVWVNLRLDRTEKEIFMEVVGSLDHQGDIGDIGYKGSR